MSGLNCILKICLIGGGCLVAGFYGPVSGQRLTPSADTDAAFEQRAAALQLDSVRQWLANPALDSDLREGMKWLYAYMPAADIANYPIGYHARNVALTFKALDELPWGQDMPERELRYFVLPARVNNEALDSCRAVFYNELAPRIKGLSMEEAVLEVNHWCHEKATYRPSDARTSTPLSTVSQAIGRCGEESTFGVAALRSVGIPARQVYTPRWAHTDDNHAWVEAWADGKWHFLGACEPEPVLDLAWFNAPASRGMLMNTKVSGRYDGPEEVIDTTPYTTVINVTENYAPTGMAEVTVTDSKGHALPGVRVDFCIYNYAMPYSVATRITDESGRASLRTGLGQTIAWASDNYKYGYGTVSPGHPLTLALDIPKGTRNTRTFTVTPPPSGARLPEVSAEARKLNNIRFAQEDSIRGAYTASFPDSLEATADAVALGLEPARLIPLLFKARGNARNLVKWLGSRDDRMLALRLLGILEEKDLRDVNTAVLSDHLDSFGNPQASDWELSYILQPRLEWEPLTPWRSALARMVGESTRSMLRANPSSVVSLLDSKLTADDGRSARGAVIVPEKAWAAALADARSRKMLAVALLRTAGVAARIDPVSGKPQFSAAEGQWEEIMLSGKPQTPAVAHNQTPISFAYDSNGVVAEPKYWSHFTLCSLEDGFPDAYDFGDFTTVDQINAAGHKVTEGDYLLMAGQRMADGSVLVHSEIFPVTRDAHEVRVVLPKDTAAIQVIGNFDAETLYRDIQSGELKSLLSTTGRGYYTLMLVSAGSEPTAHVLNELVEEAAGFEKDGRKVMVLFADASEAARFDKKLFGSFPENVVWGIDETGTVASQLPDTGEMPRIALADTFNRVVFRQNGYAIGTADRLLNLLSRLKE